ncbi:MAG TPA: helix-turn-helix domain-containing protein [Rubrobacter sp.]|nr:helix-turn-helix domain-containing protein [Rubrobacter sp.]
MEGSIYTVDDVSDLLGIPRPTLYRYLREYSIPHLRQGGRIRIPEDSFDRIREARDLHKEGLGTETVRRQLREGGGPDTGELDRRLNKLHDTLENLRGDLRAKPATGEVALSPVLQTILARQSLMLSAMFNLTGMVEDLLLKNGKGRKRPVARDEEDLVHTVPLRAEGRGQISGTVVAEPVAVREAEAPVVTSPTRNLPTSKFGTLGRRRRRSALAVLSALLLGLLLLLFLPTLDEDETAASKDPAPNAAGQQEPPEERPAGAGSDEADREGGADQDNVAEADAAPPQVETTSEEETTEDTGDTTDSSGGIPDVSGRPLEEAARILSEAGYSVAAIRSVQGPEEYGTVTGTEPSAGTEAGPNAPVVLTMSSGPTGASPAAASASASSTSASASSSSSASASASSSVSSSASSSAGATSPAASASASPSR